MSQSDPSSERAEKIRKQCDRFRILIIGRANAGKTTVLQRICNTTENPVIYNSKGAKIENSVVDASAERGSHDIENELVFQSNPGFIFHDSRGFESGGAAELIKVQEFITKRSKEKKLQDQVHAIWYCIPMDDSRPITTAELAFFCNCGTGRVPVVAIFTKFDALISKAFQALREKGMSRQDAKAQALTHAEKDFAKEYLHLIYEKQYPPKGHLYLRDMNKLEAKCPELTAQTASVLDDSVLQQLFVTTQQNNLELCMEYAVKHYIVPEVISSTIIGNPFESQWAEEELKKVLIEVFRWFPHSIYRSREGELHSLLYHLEYHHREEEEYHHHHHYLEYEEYLSCLRRNLENFQPPQLSSSLDNFIGPPPKARQLVQLCIAIVIVADHSFFLWDQRLSDNVILSALNHYQQSSHCDAVKEAVGLAYDQTFGQNTDPRDIKSSFKLQLREIVMNHRLSLDS